MTCGCWVQQSQHPHISDSKRHSTLVTDSACERGGAEVLAARVVRVRSAADSRTIASKDDLVDWLERRRDPNAYRGLAVSIASGTEDDESPFRSAHRATPLSIDRVVAKRSCRALRRLRGRGHGGRLVTEVAMVADQAQLTRE